MLRQQRQHHSGCQSVVLVEERGGLARGRLGSRQGFPLRPCPSGWLNSGCIGSSERFLQGGTLCPQRVPEGVVLHGTLESSQEVMLSQALPSPQPRQISLETAPGSLKMPHLLLFWRDPSPSYLPHAQCSDPPALFRKLRS